MKTIKRLIPLFINGIVLYIALTYFKNSYGRNLVMESLITIASVVWYVCGYCVSKHVNEE